MWRACWQGGLVVLAVWSICRLIPSMPARFQCWFWRLADPEVHGGASVPIVARTAAASGPSCRRSPSPRSCRQFPLSRSCSGQLSQPSMTTFSADAKQARWNCQVLPAILCFCLDHRRRLVPGPPAGRLGDEARRLRKQAALSTITPLDRTTGNPSEGCFGLRDYRTGCESPAAAVPCSSASFARPS